MNETGGAECVFRIAKIKEGLFLLELEDGRFLQMDSLSKEVLNRLAKKESVFFISASLDVEEDEIYKLINVLGIKREARITVIEQDGNRSTLSLEGKNNAPHQPLFFNPWIETRWFTWGIITTMLISIYFISIFAINTPKTFVTKTGHLWLVAGMLTLSVLIHELGHLLFMPRSKNIRVTFGWAGPLPLVSIICNEAWKLSKWQKIRINLGGFVADVIVGGFISMIGIIFESLTPWIWTFLVVHLFRTVFAVFPLLPGDGYWLLVDLFEQPNLWKRGISRLKKLEFSLVSMYALFRSSFYVLTWFFYFYLIYRYLAWIRSGSEELVSVLLHPVSIFLSVNLLYQFYRMMIFVVRNLKWFKRVKSVSN